VIALVKRIKEEDKTRCGIIIPNAREGKPREALMQLAREK
jgi:co-chaperonin GroES (HSP10)